MPNAISQDIYFGQTGQALIFDAPSRPASITSVEIFAMSHGDDSTTESATTGSASIESVNTTFDASSGVSQSNPRQCSLTATTSIAIGRYYLATNAKSQSEWVEVVSITSADGVLSRTPLIYDYVATDTFVSTRSTIAIDSTWVADSSNLSGYNTRSYYRARWVWVDSLSASRVDFTSFDLVRYRGEQHGVTPTDMEAFRPGWVDIVPYSARVDGGASLISQGFLRLKQDLTAIEVPDQALRDRDMLAALVKFATFRETMAAIYYTGPSPENFDRFSKADEEYQSALNRLIRVDNKLPLDTGTTGAGSSAPKIAGVWSR